jgi:hypothetical protein
LTRTTTPHELTADDLYLFAEGTHGRLADKLGAAVGASRAAVDSGPLNGISLIVSAADAATAWGRRAPCGPFPRSSLRAAGSSSRSISA